MSSHIRSRLTTDAQQPGGPIMRSQLRVFIVVAIVGFFAVDVAAAQDGYPANGVYRYDGPSQGRVPARPQFRHGQTFAPDAWRRGAPTAGSQRQPAAHGQHRHAQRFDPNAWRRGAPQATSQQPNVQPPRRYSNTSYQSRQRTAKRVHWADGKTEGSWGHATRRPAAHQPTAHRPVAVAQKPHRPAVAPKGARTVGSNKSVAARTKTVSRTGGASGSAAGALGSIVGTFLLVDFIDGCANGDCLRSLKSGACHLGNLGAGDDRDCVEEYYGQR